MPAHKINCEIILIHEDQVICPGGARARSGNTYTVGVVTPPGMCARSFVSLFPVAMAMRFSDETPWERGKGYVDVTCPEGHVIYRLTRVKNESGKTENPPG